MNNTSARALAVARPVILALTVLTSSTASASPLLSELLSKAGRKDRSASTW